MFLDKIIDSVAPTLLQISLIFVVFYAKQIKKNYNGEHQDLARRNAEQDVFSGKKTCALGASHARLHYVTPYLAL